MYFCGECGEECTPQGEDAGIGRYEFWGEKRVDTRMVLISDCCEGTVYTDEDCTVEAMYEDWSAEQEDEGYRPD